MWPSIFFDQNNNFQWASIAAIISFFAFCSTSISIYLNQIQGRKNRKSTTLVNLRLEELKDIRKEAISSISLIDAYINEKNAGVPGNKPISKSDPIIGKLNESFSKIQSKLYRRTRHGGDLMVLTATYRLKLMILEDTAGLTEINIRLQNELDKYSRIEYEEIEKYI